jgi:CheY-specific phosphatase CheX
MEEVLEKMFFIQCLGEPREFSPEPEVVAHLRFEGDPSGSLTLRVTAGAARSVSADFMGAEEQDLSEQQIGDVVCELANMICGSVLSRVESATDFRLATPQIVTRSNSQDFTTEATESGDPPPTAQCAGSSTVHAVGIGSGRMVVSISQEARAWSETVRYAF